MQFQSWAYNMAKDELDIHTIDALPAKIGRPVLNPDHGVMSPAERQARYRKGKKVVQFLLLPADVLLLKSLCKKKKCTQHELLVRFIRGIK